MGRVTNSMGEVGMSRDERSMLVGKSDDSGGSPVQQLLGVLSTMRETAESVVDGRASRLWADECMNHLILGVEVSLGQGWGELVDAFTDAGRILQSYESGGKAAQSAPYLIEAYELLCALVTDAMSGTTQPILMAQWRARYKKEVAQLEMAGLDLVDDDYDADLDENTHDALAFPDLTNDAVKLRPQDDLPTLDELPTLDSLVAAMAETSTQAQPQKPRVDATPPAARVDAERVARVEEARMQKAAESAAAKPNGGDDEGVATGPQPSRIVVELVDRICEELGGLASRSPEDRALSIEMIQGGITALKREAAKDRHVASAELCDEMLEACNVVSQCNANLDERFTDLGFAFCGVYVEAMGNSTSENVGEWRAECASLVEQSLNAATSPEVSAPPAAPEGSPPAEPEISPFDALVEEAEATHYEIESVGAQSADGDGLWIGSGAESQAPEVKEASQVISEPPPPQPLAAVVPAVRVPAPAVPPAPRASLLPSADLFVRAQEALARGDGEAAKALALQAAAMIAEAEVEKAEQLLRTAEIKLKANVTAIEEARSDVKNTEKLVMNAASEVAAGETILGQVKSQTAKVAHELQESEAEVAAIERQIAELQARLAVQKAEVETVKNKLEEARTIESESESQLSGLRDRERDTRKGLEAARQRVKDRQRGTTEIEAEMERAREMLSRQRSSLSDIRQTLNRPEPIKTAGPADEDDSLLF